MPAMEAAVLANRVRAIEEICQLAWRIKMVVLLNALIAAGYALFVAVAILLVRTYRRTPSVSSGWVWRFLSGLWRLDHCDFWSTALRRVRSIPSDNLLL